MNKQLASVNEERAKAKASAGQGLTLKELCIVTGLGYTTIRDLATEKGFPIISSRVFFEDFRDWRRQRLGISQSLQQTAARRQASTAGKSC